MKNDASALWEDFQGRLAKALEAMVEDDYLTVCVKQTNRFVQFSAQGSYGMRAEATSNSFLRGSERLNKRQVSEMKKLGWLAPTGTPEKATPERQPCGSPNFFLDFPSPPPYARIAALAVDTLVKIFKVPGPWFIEYESFDDDGNQESLTALGIKRTIRNPQIDRDEIARCLLATLTEHSRISNLEFDNDGDVGLSWGSATLYVRVTGSPTQIRFVAPLADGIRPSDRLFRRLNEINSRFGPVHFLYHEGVIYAVNDIPAWPYVAEHVTRSLDQFSGVADGIDEFLKAEFCRESESTEKRVRSINHGEGRVQ